MGLVLCYHQLDVRVGHANPRFLLLALTAEQIHLERLQQLSDEPCVHLGGLQGLKAHRVEQDLYEALQLGALEEHVLVISQVACCKAEEVVDQIRGALAVLPRGQHLNRVGDDEIEGLQEESGMLLGLPKLCQAELHGVDEGADCVLLVRCEGFPDQGLQVGLELVRQAAHAMLQQTAQSLDHCVFLHELSQQPIDEGP